MPQGLDTNDLYNMIAANKAEADKVATLAKGTPTFQENFGSTLRTQDQTLSSAVGNYSDAVAELFAHDKNMAASNLGTIGGASQADINPMIKEAYSADLFANRGKVVANSLKTLETRKALLGDIVDKSVKMYESAVKGKQIDLEASENEFANSLSVYKQIKDEELEGKKLALEYKKLQGTVDMTGDDLVDSMSDAEAVGYANKLGYNFTGGTMKERAAKAKLALAEYNQTGKINYRYLRENLPTKENDSISALADIISRADDLATTLKSGKELTGPITGRTSGWLSKTFGKTGEASMVGTELEEMSADKIKERYGGALTTTEVSRLALQAITSRKYQEADNVQKLAIMKKNALNLIREKLRGKWTDAQIEGYIQDITSSDGATNQRPSLSSFDK